MNTTATQDMKITAIAPWFGAKRKMAQRIVAELGEHRAYWEPFCGSMAVLLAKPAASMETVNDLHDDLINLARVVKDRTKGPQLYRQLRRVMMARPLYEDAAEAVRSGVDDDVDRAAAYFIASWLGRNGVAGSKGYKFGYCGRYTKNGGHAAKRFGSAVDSIPAWRRRMREVTILQDDAFGLIDRIEDAAGVVIYADPPYVEKGAQYVHDFDQWDHRKLAKALSRFKRSRVVISYYEHPYLRELYDGWTFVNCETTKSMANQGGARGAVKSPEILIINGPSYGVEQ